MGTDGETLERCYSGGLSDFSIRSSIREAHFGLSDSHRRILGRSNSLQPYKAEVRSQRYTWSVHGLDMFEESIREVGKRGRGLDWCEEYAREREERLERTPKDVSLKEVEDNSEPPLFGAATLLDDDQIHEFISGDEEDFEAYVLKKISMKRPAQSAWTGEGRKFKIVRATEESNGNIACQLSEAGPAEAEEATPRTP